MMLLRKREFYAGLFAVLAGLVAVQQGRENDIGTLTQIGPGFMPVAFGVVLVILGLWIILSAVAVADKSVPSGGGFQWRAWVCILAGPVLFIVLGQVTGFVPASLACVFVAALGDRRSTIRGAALLAIGVTTVGGFVFLYLLNVPFPLLHGGAP